MDQHRIIKLYTSHTLQVLHGGISETVLSQDGGSLLTLPASHGVLAARQRVFDIGVGDEDDQAWICQRDKGGLQRPESNHKEEVNVGCECVEVLPTMKAFCQNMPIGNGNVMSLTASRPFLEGKG